MGFYNIKVYDYLDSVHIRLYSKEIYSSEKVAGVKDLEECLLQKVRTSELRLTGTVLSGPAVPVQYKKSMRLQGRTHGVTF